MDEEKRLFAAIGAIHAAGAGAIPWEEALTGVLDFARVRAVTLDTVDRKTFAHKRFHGAGMRPTTRSEYLNLGGASNPRVVYGAAHGARLFGDKEVYGSERAIDKDPYYNEFLVHHDVRHIVCGRVAADPATVTYLSFCRSPRLGPVESEDRARMERLLPHLHHALAMSQRLGAAENKARTFESALEWLPDGTALLDARGRILHANAAFEAMVRAQDGLDVRFGAIGISAPVARQNFFRALDRAIRLGAGASISAPADFIVERPSGLPPFVVSLRPVFADNADWERAARAILFVRDPAAHDCASSFAHMGFTPAEADLAEALVSGLSPHDHARRRQVSINTVYTHLRRLKEKVGAGALPDLIYRLNAGMAVVRPSEPPRSRR